MISSRKVEGNECQPNDTSCIHCETNMFRLIKRFGNLSCQHSIHRADNNKNDGEKECDHVWRINVRVTNKKIIFTCWVMMLGIRWCYDHPHDADKNLEHDNVSYSWLSFIAFSPLTWIDIKALQIISCDCGEIKEGRFADCLLALKILAIRFVFVKSAA